MFTKMIHVWLDINLFTLLANVRVLLVVVFILAIAQLHHDVSMCLVGSD